jgi:hypothetical protein
MGVDELPKPTYTPCEHECDKGCATHGDHPPSCQEWNCWWRTGMVGGERPDKSGIIVDYEDLPDGGGTIRVWEHIPGALQRNTPLPSLLPNKPLMRFKELHLTVCSMIYPFKKVFYSMIKKGAEE